MVKEEGKEQSNTTRQEENHKNRIICDPRICINKEKMYLSYYKFFLEQVWSKTAKLLNKVFVVV